MAQVVYVDGNGRKYVSSTGPQSAHDSVLPFVDPVLLTILTAVPTDEAVVKAAFIAAKVAASPTTVGKGGRGGGWLNGFLLAAALSASLLFGGGNVEAQQIPGHIVAGASNNATLLVIGAGALTDFQGVNSTAALAYARFYDTNQVPACASGNIAGVQTVITNIPIPFATSGNGITATFPKGKAYVLGLGVCITAGNSDTDNTPLAGTGVNINFDYGTWVVP